MKSISEHRHFTLLACGFSGVGKCGGRGRQVHWNCAHTTADGLLLSWEQEEWLSCLAGVVRVVTHLLEGLQKAKKEVLSTRDGGGD